MSRRFLQLSHNEARIEIVEGMHVLFDPTGRDLDECLVVGRVLSTGADAEGDWAIVLPNGEPHTVEVRTIRMAIA